MSNKLYELVVFDWEGTVADTLGGILQTVAYEADKLGFGQLDPVHARQYVSLGLSQALKKLFPNLSALQQEELVLAVQHAMISRPAELFLIPGALKFIQQLHDAHINLAIASNKGHHSLVRAIQSVGLEDIFKVTRSAGQTLAKPSPQMLQEIMDVFGCHASDTLMIGDSTTDMEMAKSLRVDAIGVDFYHQQQSTLKTAGALQVFDDYQALADFLKLPIL